MVPDPAGQRRLRACDRRAAGTGTDPSNPLEFDRPVPLYNTFVLQRRARTVAGAACTSVGAGSGTGRRMNFSRTVLMEQSNRQLKQLVEEKTTCAWRNAYRRMEYNARHDSLTRLLNRRSVEAADQRGRCRKEPPGRHGHAGRRLASSRSMIRWDIRWAIRCWKRWARRSCRRFS